MEFALGYTVRLGRDNKDTGEEKLQAQSSE